MTVKLKMSPAAKHARYLAFYCERPWCDAIDDASIFHSVKFEDIARELKSLGFCIPDYLM
jgi:hypothetical protein